MTGELLGVLGGFAGFHQEYCSCFRKKYLLFYCSFTLIVNKIHVRYRKTGKSKESINIIKLHTITQRSHWFYATIFPSGLPFSSLAPLGEAGN